MAKRRRSTTPSDAPPREPNYTVESAPGFRPVPPVAPLSSTGPGTAAATALGRDYSGVIARHHPRYDSWSDTWTWLGHIYEGDGPFADGSALTPHIRELLYKTTTDEDGKKTVDFDTVVGEKIKFTQRKQIARYENFAATIVDALVDAQYSKPITRSVEKGEGQALLARAPIEEFWSDCDGYGTSLDAWLHQRQILTHTYGHLFVLMDRMRVPSFRSNITPAGQKTSITTLADQGRPVLRFYIPSDAPDWLAPFNEQLTAIKFIEAIERKSLLDAILPTQSRALIWDTEQWMRFDPNGYLVASAPHGMGELPVFPWYARKRSRIPVIGRSVLRDPKLYIDHFNMISELREIMRSQTFSMLHIELTDNETVEQARGRLGDHAGTDSLVFTRGGASFIAPPDGPATVYANELSAAERKIYRLVGLPWESDSKDAEAEGSLQKKRAQLDALLATHAANAQVADRHIARLWYKATYGAERGTAAFAANPPAIHHPDNFDVEDLASTLRDAQSTIALGVGQTATRLIKLRVLGLALPRLDAETKSKVEAEVTALVDVEETRAQELHDAAVGRTKGAAGFGAGSRTA